MLEMWGAEGWDRPAGEQPHEAKLLKLDCSKARAALGWRPRLSLEKALEMVVDWHKSVADGDDAREVSLRQLREYDDLVNVGAGGVTASSALGRGRRSSSAPGSSCAASGASAG